MIWYYLVLAYFLGMWLFCKIFMIVFERSGDRERMKFRLTGRKVNVKEPYSAQGYWTHNCRNPIRVVYFEEKYPYRRMWVWPVMVVIYLTEFLIFEPLKNLLTKKEK